MIIAIEHLDAAGNLVIEHLNPDGTVDTIDTGLGIDDHTHVDEATAQISVYMNDEPGNEYYMRLGEVRNPDGGPVVDVVQEMIDQPLRAYSDILKVYVDSHKMIDDDEGDDDDDFL